MIPIKCLIHESLNIFSQKSTSFFLLKCNCLSLPLLHLPHSTSLQYFQFSYCFKHCIMRISQLIKTLIGHFLHFISFLTLYVYKRILNPWNSWLLHVLKLQLWESNDMTLKKNYIQTSSPRQTPDTTVVNVVISPKAEGGQIHLNVVTVLSHSEK